MFVKENNKYNKIYEQDLTNDFAYYNEVSFAVVNYSISDNIKYNMETNPSIVIKLLKLKSIDDIFGV